MKQITVPTIASAAASGYAEAKVAGISYAGRTKDGHDIFIRDRRIFGSYVGEEFEVILRDREDKELTAEVQVTEVVSSEGKRARMVSPSDLQVAVLKALEKDIPPG